MSSTINLMDFTIQSQKTYEILIGNLSPQELLTELCQQLSTRKLFVVDVCLQEHYPALFEEWSYPTLFLKGGEQVKTISTAMEICDFLSSHHAGREDALVVVGGGTIGDVAGFAASLYKRGVNWHFVPTTLLAQVDSSIGGKVAINRDHGRNIIGAFWPARKVWITTDFLNSLPKIHSAAGMAEIIKVAALGDENLWQLLNDGNEKVVFTLIEMAIQAKLQIIENDWFEETNGTRAALNFGHTIGHALEKIDLTLLHGQAVALGMLIELKIGEFLGDKVFSYSLLAKCLKKYGLSIVYSNYLTMPKIDSLINFMKQDKKNEEELVSFRVPLEAGGIKKILVSAFRLKEILISV